MYVQRERTARGQGVRYAEHREQASKQHQGKEKKNAKKINFSVKVSRSETKAGGPEERQSILQ